MPIRKADLAVFVYVLAVMLSGMWMADQFGMDWSPTLLAATAVVAAAWTGYYRYAVGPRIEATTSDGGAETARDDGEGETPREDRRPDSGPRE